LSEERDVKFNILHKECNYKTTVTVTIDWSGKILSGKGDKHNFKCLGCEREFTVNNNELQPHVNRFV